MARVVFLWHLHQPEYRDPVSGQPVLPWVRLHSTRAYNDMVRWIAAPTLTGCPATVAPAGPGDSGLPIGVQIMGPF